MTTKVDLNALERVARAADESSSYVVVGCKIPWWPADSASLDEAGVGVTDRAHSAANSPPETLALIARIRELEALIRAFPAAGLQSDKVYRDEFPELFTAEDGAALYMDEAARRLLARGVVLP